MAKSVIDVYAHKFEAMGYDRERDDAFRKRLSGCDFVVKFTWVAKGKFFNLRPELALLVEPEPKAPRAPAGAARRSQLLTALLVAGAAQRVLGEQVALLSTLSSATLDVNGWFELLVDVIGRMEVVLGALDRDALIHRLAEVGIRIRGDRRKVNSKLVIPDVDPLLQLINEDTKRDERT